jgi:hypothetical protein
LQKLATIRNIAIVVLNQSVTKMQPGARAILISAVSSTAWDTGIATSIALFRDWGWNGKHVRYARILRANGSTDVGKGAIGKVLAFTIESVSTHASECLRYSKSVRQLTSTFSTAWTRFRSQRQMPFSMGPVSRYLLENEKRMRSWTVRMKMILRAQTKTMDGRRMMLKNYRSPHRSGRVVKIFWFQGSKGELMTKMRRGTSGRRRRRIESWRCMLKIEELSAADAQHHRPCRGID